MTSVSWLYYGRRTRLNRGSSDFDDLGFISSPSSSPSSSDRSHDSNHSHRHRCNSRKAGSSTSACGRSDRRRLHPRSDQHHRQNRHVTPGEFDESGRSSGFPRQPCSEATALDGVPIQQFEGVTESPIQNLVHVDTLNSIRGRFNSNERLPISVLLARERLVQRLQGVSVSSVRQSHETHPATHFDNYWLNDSGSWHPSNSEEHLAEIRSITESTSISDSQALDKEALTSLHHEVFTKVVNADSNQKFSVSDECSICLEMYADGNDLVGLTCGHRFHSSCLSPWIQTCRKCPYCRSEISSQ